MKKESFVKKLRPNKKPSTSSIVRKIESIQAKRFEWINMQNPDRSNVEEIAKKFNFNELNIEDSLTKFELPKLDVYNDHFFVILHFPPLAQKVGISKNSQLSIFLGKDFLVTIHQGDLKPLVELTDICNNNSDIERKQSLLGESAGSLLHEIIDVLIDDLLHTSRKIITSLDEMEDKVFDDRRSVARNIALLRREINRLRRISNHLNIIIPKISENIEKFNKNNDNGKEEDLTLYFDDVIDHIHKIIETLEESREIMEIYKDTDFLLSTEKTNKVLALLTIVFTLAIPSTIIGTFYGMNIVLPINDSMFLGPFTTFILVIIASAIPTITMFICFKKLGWISS